jgi:hypothetical protein
MSSLKVQNAVACCLTRARESLNRRNAASRFIDKLASKPSWTKEEISELRERVEDRLPESKPR